MTPETLATEAHWLLDNPTLLRAVAEMRLEALEALATIDAYESEDIAKQQARVYACDELIRTLERFIEAASVQ